MLYRKALLSRYHVYIDWRHMLYIIFDICILIYVNNVYVSEINILKNHHHCCLFQHSLVFWFIVITFITVIVFVHHFTILKVAVNCFNVPTHVISYSEFLCTNWASKHSEFTSFLNVVPFSCCSQRYNIYNIPLNDEEEGGDDNFFINYDRENLEEGGTNQIETDNKSSPYSLNCLLILPRKRTNFITGRKIRSIMTFQGHHPHKVSKVAKIRNRYNQVPNLTKDTNGKVTNSQLYTTNESQ